jgi:hypothetical protein
MPYRHAHYFVGFVLAVIMAGFWASYFGADGPAPLAFHVHAVSSMTWLGLLIAQHLSIQRRANALHRQMGRASFVLFPFLILGFVMIINVTANRYSAGEDPFIAELGSSFAIGMAVAIAAYLTLFSLALRHRHTLKLHAGYMLATPLILFESPFSRVIEQFLPWMNVIGSEGPRAVLDVIVISDMLAMAFALGLYFTNRKHGAPWLVAAAFIGLQAALVWVAPDTPLIGRGFAAYAAVPPGMALAIGIVAALAAMWWGWEAGKPRARRARAAA